MNSDESGSFKICLGELTLSGELHRGTRVLPITLKARAMGKRVILVPADNADYFLPLA